MIDKNIQRKANAFARKMGYGKATKVMVKNPDGQMKIVRARSWQWETMGGTPIRYPSAYSKKGFSNMRYSHAYCEIEIV